MDDGRQGVALVNSGRFHFDPQHDPSGMPSGSDLEMWARSTATREGSGIAHALSLIHRVDDEHPGIVARVLRLVPALARRARRTTHERCIAVATRELERLRELMREFAVDLTRREDQTTMVDAIAATAIIDMTQQQTLRVLDGHEDRDDPNVVLLRSIVAEIDTRGKLERYHAGVRTMLENEAVMNLVLSDELRRDHARQMAALRAAREEVVDEAIRGSIDEVLARSEN